MLFTSARAVALLTAPFASRKKKVRGPKKPIVGPMFETLDVGVPAGDYIDITPLEPLPDYGRVERGVLKKVLRPGVGGESGLSLMFLVTPLRLVQLSQEQEPSSK